MERWLQNYDPLGNAFLSTIVAALPVVVLLTAIALFHIRIHRSALLGLAVALAVALFSYRMPLPAAAAATLYGALYGLFPIGWIILNLIFLYQLTVKKGLFEVLRDSLGTFAPDQRVQVILIAFSFGAFFEGAAGFGTPVAVTAAILIQLGFKPLQASGLSLIANTAPVAYGALGTPIIALSGVTGLDLHQLSAMAGRQLPFFSVIVPFWVVWAFAGFRGMLGVWPAALTAAVAFAVPQFLVSNFHGPWLVDIVASMCSMAALGVLLKCWRPKDNWKPADGVESEEAPKPTHTPAEIIRAWVPWVLLSVCIFIWGLPHFKKFTTGADSLGRSLRELFDSVGSATVVPFTSKYIPRPIKNLGYRLSMTITTVGESLEQPLHGIVLPKEFVAPRYNVPNLHNFVVRKTPVVPMPTPEKPTKPEEAIFALNWLSATGTGILASAIFAGSFMGCRLGEMARTYWETLVRVRFSLITIAAMLALGYVTKYSGTDATLGLALAKTGAFYPFFGTLLGWLGVALTGSDTASNVLFGSLQTITAKQTGLNPVLMAAANSSGGVMGKMVDAQSIVVASTATNWYGHEDKILRYVFFHSIALACLVGILVYLQAYVAPFTRMVVK